MLEDLFIGSIDALSSITDLNVSNEEKVKVFIRHLRLDLISKTRIILREVNEDSDVLNPKIEKILNLLDMTYEQLCTTKVSEGREEEDYLPLNLPRVKGVEDTFLPKMISSPLRENKNEDYPVSKEEERIALLKLEDGTMFE